MDGGIGTVPTAAEVAIPGSKRPRRLRLNAGIRGMVRETRLSIDDFVYPLFVTHGKNVRNEIGSMPGVFQWSIDNLAREAESIAAMGIPAVLLFGLPAGHGLLRKRSVECRTVYDYFAAAASSAARSVFSQVNSGSLRPKCPPEAVLR